MDKRLSIKFSILSFLLLIHVVIGHSINEPNYVEGGSNWVWFIENYISERLIKIIIPLFFFISAYLFFFNITPNVNDGPETFKEKIGKRIRTLGIPYLFWCTFWFAVLLLFQSIPMLSTFFPSHFGEMSLYKQFWNLYIEPVNYQFWFLRELLLYVLVTPILYLLVKYLKMIPSLIFFILSLFIFGIHVLEIDIYRFHMLAYYCLGIYCGINKVNLVLRFNSVVQFLLVAAWLGLSGMLIWFDINHIDTETVPMRLLSNLITALGFVAVWSLYDYLDNKFEFKYHNVFSYGFIIYAVHALPILWLKEGLVIFFNPGKVGLLIFYVLSFTSVIFGCILLGMFLKKFMPKVYLFTTGNR